MNRDTQALNIAHFSEFAMGIIFEINIPNIVFFMHALIFPLRVSLGFNLIRCFAMRMSTLILANHHP